VNLSTSFRSVPALQSAINSAFAPIIQASSAGQPDYVPLGTWRKEFTAQPSLIVLPVPRPYSYREVTHRAIDDSLPDATGALVEWLINESGWTVTERARPEDRVPIEPRHICILLRRFQSWGDDVTRPYVRALEARRIPHVLLGGRAFHEREEVLAIRNALEAIERPQDELSVFATLRGPLFALSDDALLAFRHEAGRLHPLRKVATAGLSPGAHDVSIALDILGDLHLQRNRRPIAETLSVLLSKTRAHAGIAIWPTGEQSLANVLRVMDVGRRFEAAGATSFRAFVDYLADEAEAGEAADAPVIEEGTEGVRMMTVHKAKGLEFPVVILADLSAQATRDTPSRHVDQEKGLWVEPLCQCAPPELVENAQVELQRDREEAVRLAYVAATRARDLLVVPAVGDEEVPSWVQALYPVIYPVNKRSPKPTPDCPSFGTDSVLERPDECPRTSKDSVAPGEHQARAGGGRVVWWDPGVLALGKEQALGLRQQKLLLADEAGASDEGVRAHGAWRTWREMAIETASQPQFLVRRVTELAPMAAGGPEEIVIAHTPGARTAGRPSGRRFGGLVHAILSAVDLRATDKQTVRQVAGAQARLFGATDEELSAATDAVWAALSHPVLRRAAGSPERLRETPLVLRLQDGTLAEGTLDLAFREGDAWTVVDFKTDSELEGSRTRYEGQVRLYARALAEATGRQARGLLLVV
jgi:ATP-dependent exoDNAse (exonuclease V) beta subunit